MVMFICHAKDEKYSFFEKFGPKNQNCLRWNLVIRLIRICWIRWWCSDFLFRTGSTFFGQIWFKKAKLSDCDETWCLDYSNMVNSMVMLLCSVEYRKYTFGQIWLKKSIFYGGVWSSQNKTGVKKSWYKVTNI